MRLLAAIALLVPAIGCRQVLGLDDLDPPEAAIDAMSDAMSDAAPTQVCYGTLVRVCVEPSDAAITLDGALDTDSAPQCVPATSQPNTPACVIIGRTVDVRNVRATGSRSLFLVAATNLTINGTLDVASHYADQTIGPGGDASVCVAGTAPTFQNDGGGGGGGTFGTRGGSGGDGGDGNGGTSGVFMVTTRFRGGCPGAAGADGALAGVRGHGGGAVYVIAGETLQIAGAINASGGAGGGSTTARGAGGGGSGGMVVLEAAMIAIDGVVIANGGGGGEGAATTDTGNPGAEPTILQPTASALGGSGGSVNGGNGGAGAVGAALGGVGFGGQGAGASGGGGGGGGVGIVRVLGTRSGAGTVSPPAN